jgi:hypothetical protein
VTQPLAPSTKRATTQRPLTAVESCNAHPEYRVLLYNVACCESRAGQPADAIEHLRRAIERSDRCRSLAASDPDFDPAREDPAFKALVDQRNGSAGGTDPVASA